jgi:hypothetical protein
MLPFRNTGVPKDKASEEQYLILTETNIILNDLYSQCSSKKPEEGVDFCVAYLKQVETCYHIVGCSFSYILESVHNRKSFLFCLLNSLKGFNANYEMSSSELYLLIEMLCPDFPKALLTEAALTLAEQATPVASLGEESKYAINVLSKAVVCNILYNEWLKAMEEGFRLEGKGFTLSVAKIKARCDLCYRGLPISCPQPSIAALQCIQEEASKSSADMSFARLKKAVFSSDAVTCELRLLADYPSTL